MYVRKWGRVESAKLVDAKSKQPTVEGIKTIEDLTRYRIRSVLIHLYNNLINKYR
jgi:hypothetical protein